MILQILLEIMSRHTIHKPDKTAKVNINASDSCTRKKNTILILGFYCSCYIQYLIEFMNYSDSVIAQQGDETTKKSEQWVKK